MVHPDLLSSLSPATQNVNSGLYLQNHPPLIPIPTNQHILLYLKISKVSKIMTSITPDIGGILPVRVSALLSVARDIAPWKYSVPKSAVQKAKPKRLMTATVVVSANLMTRKVAMEIATQEAGITLPGQR